MPRSPELRRTRVAARGVPSAGNAVTALRACDFVAVAVHSAWHRMAISVGSLLILMAAAEDRAARARGDCRLLSRRDRCQAQGLIGIIGTHRRRAHTPGGGDHRHSFRRHPPEPADTALPGDFLSDGASRTGRRDRPGEHPRQPRRCALASQNTGQWHIRGRAGQNHRCACVACSDSSIASEHAESYEATGAGGAPKSRRSQAAAPRPEQGCSPRSLPRCWGGRSSRCRRGSGEGASG